MNVGWDPFVCLRMRALLIIGIYIVVPLILKAPWRAGVASAGLRALKLDEGAWLSILLASPKDLDHT